MSVKWRKMNISATYFFSNLIVGRKQLMPLESFVMCTGKDCAKMVYKQFKEGNFSTEDSPRSGRPIPESFDENLDAAGHSDSPRRVRMAFRNAASPPY